MTVKTSSTVQLASELISRPSVTPNDAGCQELIIKRLESLDFKSEPMMFDEVTNTWLRRGKAAPLFVFAGHTDVVPPGPFENWKSHPFKPDIDNGFLYGRGAADMKGEVAAMVVAVEQFVQKHPDHKGSIALLLTSDEEGPSINGTKRVIETLKARQEKIDYCIVGEPTSSKKLGDTIKNGRRGSLTGRLFVHGIQGHIAYPQLAANPIHLFAPAQAELCAKVWDQGDDYFQPTSFQISNIQSGAGADNVIPGVLDCRFNFRFSPQNSPETLEKGVREILDKHDFKYDLKFTLQGNPFITARGPLVDVAQEAIKAVTGLDSELSTSGGTSDGRFIAPTGAQVIELGVVNDTIHKVNEKASVEELDQLTVIYERILEKLLV